MGIHGRFPKLCVMCWMCLIQAHSAVITDFTDKKDYVATQVGNPEKGPDAPNKKYYDPR